MKEQTKGQNKEKEAISTNFNKTPTRTTLSQYVCPPTFEHRLTLLPVEMQLFHVQVLSQLLLRLQLVSFLEWERHLGHLSPALPTVPGELVRMRLVVVPVPPAMVLLGGLGGVVVTAVTSSR
jgi:hypothetical protein